MNGPSSPAHHKSDSRLSRLSQLYLAQSQINDAVARATEFHRLCDDVCRIVVETGKIACALVRLLDAPQNVLVPLAFHGPYTGLVGRRELPTDQALGVSAVAFRTGKPVVIHDALHNPTTVNIGKAAAELNVRSAAAYPLLSNGQPFGTFALFAIGTDFFDDELSQLLEKTAGILAFAHDKLVADTARAEVEHRNREMVERSPMAIRIIQDGRIVMINRAGLDQLGYATFEEIGSTTLEDFIHPDQREIAAALMADMLASSSNGYTREYLNRHRDGHYYPVEVTARPFTFDGRPAVLAYIHDLTERRHAEQAVRESEQRLQLAMNASQSGVWDWNLKTGKAFLSDEYYRMFGYEPGEVEGNVDTLISLVHPKNREQTRAALKQQWESGVAATDYEQRFVCKDGTVKWVQIRATILRDAEGRAERMVGTAIDLTERKERERRILQLSRLNSALGKINAAVARVTDFATLANDACRIAVEEGGFISAVIRTVDTALEQLTQIADAGLRDGFLGLASVSLATNRGVTTRAFHARKPVVVRDLANDPITSYAVQDGKRLGINAGVAFPLMVGGVPIGTITVWGRDASFIDEQNLNLLQQMVDAVAFAHAKLEADAAVIARERDTRLAQEAGNIGSVIIDLRAGKWTTSPMGFTVLGLPPEQWYPLARFEAMLAPETRDATMTIMRANVASGKPTQQDYEFIREADGARRWLRVKTDSEFDAAGKALRRIGTLQDVTEEHVARARTERASRLYAALSKTNETVMRNSNFDAVAASVCAIAVDFGGMAAAVVRLYDASGDVLRRVASGGVRFGVVGSDTLPLEPEDGLAATAFNNGHLVQVNDLHQIGSPLGRAAAQAGLKTAVSFPLLDATGKSIGTFTVFATELRSFDRETVGLLQEIADALSFACDKYQTDAALATSRRDLELAQEAGRIGSAILDVKAGTWQASRIGCEILGLPEVKPLPISAFLALLAPASRDLAISNIRANLNSLDLSDHIYEIVHQGDRQPRWIRLVLAGELGKDGTVVRRLGTLQDVTHQQLSEQRANHLSRLYAALSETNESIVHAADFDALCKAVCQIVVERGGLVSSAIRLLNDGQKLLTETAAYGPRRGILGRTDIPIDDTRGVAVHAFRSRKPFLIPNLAADPRTEESSAAAAEIGITAAAAFPLTAQGQVIGVFSVWASDGAWLDVELAGLLTEIAESLSFAHDKLAADARLSASERDLLQAQRSGSVGSISYEVNSGKWGVSEVGAELLGLTSTGPFSYKDWKALLLPDHRDESLVKLKDNAGSGEERTTVYHISRAHDAKARWIETRLTTANGPGGPGSRRVGTLRDITDEVVSRERIERLSCLYAALSKTNEAIVHADDYATLATDICRIIVDEGRLISAVIRLFHPEAHALVEAGAHGPRTGALGRPSVPVDDPHGLAVVAFRHGKRVIVANIDEHFSTRHAQNDSHANGIVAGAAFPMRAGGETIGTMTLFADRPEAFDDQMADLIEEIADSAAFAHAKIANEHARRDADARMAAIVDSAMDAIITCDDAQRIVVFNDAAQRMFHIAETDAIGRSLNVLLPARFHTEHPRWMKSFGNQSSGSRTMGRLAQVTALRKDGVEFPVEASISHTDLSGKRFYTVIMRDVTAKLANQRALEETESRYRRLVETSLNCVMLLDGERIVYANPASATILGFDGVADITGTSVYDHCQPEHQETTRREIARMMQRAGESLDRQLLKLHRRDSTEIETYATANSINVDGRILIQLELRDVTRERRALAEVKALAGTLEARVAQRTHELSLSNRELEAANRDLESFSYSVAHDLRAPLRSIIGFSELLELDITDKEYQDAPGHTGRIIASAKRMNELIDGLLTVSRVTHGPLGDDPVNMAQLAQDAVNDCNVGDKYRITVGKLPQMHGDALSMRQVWANLVSNAVKYSGKRDHPVVDIGCETREGETVFHVRDNGAGFDSAYADRLFGVFQRLHTLEEFDGTGVGLAVVRRVVERHGGRVWAEAALDKGATFYFALPEARLLKTA